jgi:hypothetical protein
LKHRWHLGRTGRSTARGLQARVCGVASVTLAALVALGFADQGIALWHGARHRASKTAAWQIPLQLCFRIGAEGRTWRTRIRRSAPDRARSAWPQVSAVGYIVLTCSANCLWYKARQIIQSFTSLEDSMFLTWYAPAHDIASVAWGASQKRLTAAVDIPHRQRVWVRASFVCALWWGPLQTTQRIDIA